MDAPLVYVVDDDPVAVRALEALLAEETNFEVAGFTSSQAAEQAALERAPDAVIADLRMKEPDGLSLIERLSARDSELASLIATGHADGDAATQVLSTLGPLRHVTKPFAGTDVLPKLRAALEHRTVSRELRLVRERLKLRDQALRVSRKQVEHTAQELETTHSELATATERLVEAEQLAAVGRVVTGLAHEIGSQLALVGYAEAIKARVGDDSELAEFADIIVAAQKRLTGLVDEIRDFCEPHASGHDDTLEREQAELSLIVDEALAILRHDADVRTRKLVRDYRARPLVALHRQKFAQVIVNLVTNAALATRSGETITVEVDSVDSDFATLTVTDTGCGMPNEVLERLGEPFFTTRGDRGSGLGIGICMRIVEEHGGSLTYCSDLGEGTIAKVRIPLVPNET
jgi:signal transduction histidine kinase